MQTTMTTTQALRQLIRCHITIAINTWRAVDYFVTRRSWIALVSVVVASVAVSAVNIMQARAERDTARKAQAKLQEQIEQLSCAVEAERSEK